MPHSCRRASQTGIASIRNHLTLTILRNEFHYGHDMTFRRHSLLSAGMVEVVIIPVDFLDGSLNSALLLASAF